MHITRPPWPTCARLLDPRKVTLTLPRARNYLLFHGRLLHGFWGAVL